MIDTKELRIGNYLYDAKERLAIVEEIQKDEFTAYSGSITTLPLKPIPLTEDWLIKFGFEKTTENDGNLICYKKGIITIALWIGGKWQLWIGTKDIRNSPQFVHKLQNFYYEFNDVELKIK